MFLSVLCISQIEAYGALFFIHIILFEKICLLPVTPYVSLVAIKNTVPLAGGCGMKMHVK